MAKSLPPLAWFRAFDAAARCLSFTAAAHELGMTQSAVSQQVKSLEARLGEPLFRRHARGLSLTDAARRLVPEVAAALEKLTVATHRFDGRADENQLSVASSVSVAHWVLSPHLHSFTARHPALRIRFLSAIWPDDFHTALADVEIRFGSEKQVGKDAVLLNPNRLVALKAPHLVGTLEELPLIEAVGTSAAWKAWGERIGGQTKPRLFADSYGMALQLAANGNGVSLTSELLAGHAIHTGQLVRAHAGSIDGPEGYFLSINAQNPYAVHFRDWLIALLRKPMD